MCNYEKQQLIPFSNSGHLKEMNLNKLRQDNGKPNLQKLGMWLAKLLANTQHMHFLDMK